MSRVSDILSRKGDQVHTIPRGATVYEAIEKMVGENVGALLVTDGDEIVGIITERDYLSRIPLKGRRSQSTRVEEIMTADIVCVDPSLDVEECMAIVTQRRIRHLPVMDGSRLVGILSIGDLVKHISREQEIHIRYLTDYISGKYPG